METYEYKSIEELVKLAEEYDIPISQVVIEREKEMTEKSEADIREVMDQRLHVFFESIEAGRHNTERSVSGLVGGDAAKFDEAVPALLGPVARRAVSFALAISEANAKMFKIVACPTAGSCGIVPAVLMSAAREIHASRDDCIDVLFTAAGIGEVVARNACVAGATGACQAECGTAAAMAAGAVTELMEGRPDQVSQAVALCLKNVLGLACDPVAGLVEVPCVKRNGFFAVHALTAAEMALSGIRSVIPTDEVISAMYEIGRMMPVALKETSEGGLAKTKTGKEIAKRMEKSMQAK